MSLLRDIYRTLLQIFTAPPPRGRPYGRKHPR